MRNSLDPCTCLAVIWASKEATYKLVSKQLGGSRFVPRQFVTQFNRHFSFDSYDKLVIFYGGAQINVEITRTAQWAHAVATFPGINAVRWAVREIEKCTPPSHQAQTESKAARQLASELLSNCGFADIVLTVAGGAPTATRNNREAVGLGISLSHHGAFVSAAIGWRLTNYLPSLSVYRLAESPTLEETCSTSTA